MKVLIALLLVTLAACEQSTVNYNNVYESNRLREVQ